MAAAACAELEAHFAGCSSDLDAIAQTLEAGFDKHGLYRRNPAQMLQRLKALREDLPKVQEDWRKIMVAKQNVIEAAAKTHIPTCRALKGLCRATEVPTSGEGQESCVTHFEQLSQEFDKENAAQIANAMQHAAMLSSKDLEVEVLNTLCCQPASQEDEKAKERNPSLESAGGEPPGAALQATKHAITEEEFKSVSNVVRGRCKLEECNMLLEQVRRVTLVPVPCGVRAGLCRAPCKSAAPDLLCSMRTVQIISHQKKQNTKRQLAITTSDLAAIGARATGQTGARCPCTAIDSLLSCSQFGVIPWDGME